jgi:hypothetical protein
MCGGFLGWDDAGKLVYDPHHMPPVGMGGSSFEYPDHQIIIGHRGCHDHEHAEGCPHTEGWIEMLRRPNENMPV